MVLRAGHANVEQAGVLLALFFAIVMQGVYAADDDAREFAAFATVNGTDQNFVWVRPVMFAFVAANGILQRDACLL